MERGGAVGRLEGLHLTAGSRIWGFFVHEQPFTKVRAIRTYDWRVSPQVRPTSLLVLHGGAGAPYFRGVLGCSRSLVERIKRVSQDGDLFGRKRPDELRQRSAAVAPIG